MLQSKTVSNKGDVPVRVIGIELGSRVDISSEIGSVLFRACVAEFAGLVSSGEETVGVTCDVIRGSDVEREDDLPVL